MAKDNKMLTGVLVGGLLGGIGGYLYSTAGAVPMPGLDVQEPSQQYVVRHTLLGAGVGAVFGGIVGSMMKK